MMVTEKDFIRLPYSADLTQTGIDYALRSLPYTYDRMGGSRFDRLRRIVAGKAVELAFRRWLVETGAPHDLMGATPFTDPDRYDIAIGGRRCDVKSFHLLSRPVIQQVRRSPGALLAASALAPADQLAAQRHDDDDLYVFAFLLALATKRMDELQKPLAAGQPVCIIHPLPEAWSRPQPWASLGELALKSEADIPLQITLGGQEASREFTTLQATLLPRVRAALASPLHSLAAIQVSALPPARLGVYSPRLRQTYLIEPHEWGNIWIYGMEILLVGYITHAEFRQRADHLPAGSRVFQYAQTRTANFSLPVTALHPLADLPAAARAWVT